MDRHGANKFITYLGALPNQPCSDRDCWNRSRWFRIAHGRVLEQEMDIHTHTHTHTHTPPTHNHNLCKRNDITVAGL